MNVEGSGLNADYRAWCARPRRINAKCGIPALGGIRFSVAGGVPYYRLMTPAILLAFWMIWNDAGCEALRQGRPADAAVAFRNALATSADPNDPQTAMLWRNLSVAYTGEGLYQKAEHAAQTSL